MVVGAEHDLGLENVAAPPHEVGDVDEKTDPPQGRDQEGQGPLVIEAMVDGAVHDGEVRRFGDDGTPAKMFSDTDDFVSVAIEKVVANTAGQISTKSEEGVALPTLSIE